MNLTNSRLRRLVIMLCVVAPLVLFCAESAYAGRALLPDHGTWTLKMRG